ncbi:MAG TPA: PAS domain-containing protein [Verrucomicrobiae bacterium]
MKRFVPVAKIRRAFTLLLFFFTCFEVQGAAPIEPRRVLLLHSFGREFAPFIAFSENFRTELSRNSPVPVDYFDFALVTARFENSEEGPFIAYLNSLFNERSVDLIVPMGGPAVRFAQKYRSQLFPEVPMLFASVDQRMIEYSSLTSKDAVVAVDNDARPIVEALVRLLPGTTNIAIIFGDNFVGHFWTDQFDQAIKEYAPGVSSERFTQLSYEEMMFRAERLPPHSAIICGQILVDAHGVPQVQDPLRTLHSVANAPMFGLHDYQLGNGIVGGPLVSIREASHQSAVAAARILGGEAPANIRPPPIGAAQPTYDWRELRRWRIPSASLPPGARIEFRELSTMERHKWHIVAILSICAAQAVLISLLLTNLAKRRRAERYLRESEERMSLAADSAQLGMWVWDAHSSKFWATEKWKEIHACPANRDIPYDTWIARIHPEDRRRVEKALFTALKKHSSFHLEHRLLLPDGAIRWISKSGRIEHVSNGTPTRLLGISIDITERKETEAAAHEASEKLITAREEERKRIARDLHDDVNQRLALLSIEMHLLGRMEKDSETKEQIERIAAQVSEVSSEVHKVSCQLHPANLEQLGLVAATQALCQAFSKRSQLSVEFNHDEIPPVLDQKIALCLYRIIQEALQNTIKHSHATHAKILLHREGDSIHLLVSDDGLGFDMINASHRASLGLVGMRERVQQVDGHITFKSVPGGGTEIIAVVPTSISASNEDDFPHPKAISA